MSNKVTQSMLEHVASLSKLKLNTDELTGHQDDLGKILKYVEELEQINTEGVKAFTSPTLELE